MGVSRRRTALAAPAQAQADIARHAELVICDQTIERSNAWTARFRRLARDYEELAESSKAWIYLAMSRLYLRRLARLAY